MSKEEILMSIGNISPQAKDYVYNNYKDVKVFYAIHIEQNEGVFLKVDNADCCIFYASFLNEENVDEPIELINSITKEYISKMDSKEVCFNVYGKNPKIINLVRTLGFKLDIEGYYLEYVNKELPQLKKCSLTEKGFVSSMLNEFIDLFDCAYYQLNIDNGWDINTYAKTKEQFHERLNTLNQSKQVYSFWLGSELVGAYIIKQNYIMDIVVNPMYHNKGYGTYILAHCINNMKVNKSIDNIRLGVVKSNTGAKQLYERNGFVVISSHAEHTYC